MKRRPVYMDVCALCRPFDEQGYARIRLETDAVNLILANVRNGCFKFLVSPVHRKEIEAITATIERLELLAVLEEYGERANVDLTAARERAEDLYLLGFGVADAAHVAFAELAGADLISCDDKLLKLCRRNGIAIWCGDPVLFCAKEDLK